MIGPISGKVTASTVAASATTLVCSILAPHVFPGGVPSDIQGLVETGVTAIITFVSGYMARHGVVTVVEREAEKVATSPATKAIEAVAAPFLPPVVPVTPPAPAAQPGLPVDAVPPVGI